jgi:hypothetical protein
VTVESSCHCGAVRLQIEAVPQTVTDCNCSICRRYGVLWAYYAASDVQVSGETDTYMWDDKAIAFHRCRICGCVTHWSAVDPRANRVGINARLMPPEILARARVRRLDGAVTEKYLDQ